MNGCALENFPVYTEREHRADRLVHALGLVSAMTSAVWLLAARSGTNATDLLALLVYLGALVAMLATSAAYNLASPGRWKAALRRADHAAIFVMIAGTFTPFAVRGLPQQAGALWGAWTVAAAGAFVKLVFPRRLERAGLLLYLGLGWAVLFLSWDLWRSLPEGVLPLLCAGGALYTLGSCVHLLERVRYHNAAWHALVLAGAAFHFAAVASL